ncbi:MAG: hypothetical protein MJZ65_00775 [Paludibacteraceae bacterium]|nr:hypothetical protein [Paludibacteraceae bacterium]
MKKIFFFAAAMCAALTASAINNGTYSFANVAAAGDFTITGAKANSGTTETKLVYDMEAAGTPIVATPTALSSDIKFTIVHNSEAKTKYFTIALGDYFEFGGKGGILEISNAPIGQTLVLHIANKSDKGDGKIAIADCVGVNGADVTLPAKTSDGYTYVDAEYQITAPSVSIKENVYGYRIQSITIGAGTGLPTVAAEAAQNKIIVNGQMKVWDGKAWVNMLGL